MSSCSRLAHYARYDDARDSTPQPSSEALFRENSFTAKRDNAHFQTAYLPTEAAREAFAGDGKCFLERRVALLLARPDD